MPTTASRTTCSSGTTCRARQAASTTSTSRVPQTTWPAIKRVSPGRVRPWPGAVSTKPSPGEDYTLRWIYLHMIEEYARHNGHADFLRERIDGATGE